MIKRGDLNPEQMPEGTPPSTKTAKTASNAKHQDAKSKQPTEAEQAAYDLFKQASDSIAESRRSEP